MKVHLIRKETIAVYTNANVQSRNGFGEWLIKLKYVDWDEPGDIQNTFPSADFLGNGSHRIVFDIGGNKYRMVAKYAFGDNEVHLFVCWIGTHAAYSKLCKAGLQYTVSIY